MSNSALPDHLKGKLHNDYWFPFCYIPRSWTSYKLVQPPKLICGRKVHDYTSRKYHKDSNVSDWGPDPCQKTKWSWCFSLPFHFTITFKKMYLRIGCRWDTIDEYFTVPAFFFGRIDGGIFEKEEDRIIYRGVSRWAK
jgi:hypothetical protein